MMKKNKGGNNGKTGKKSASLVISNNFSLLDPDNEEIAESAPAPAPVAAPEPSGAAAAAAASEAQNGYKPLKLKSVYIHNQSWKTIA